MSKERPTDSDEPRPATKPAARTRSKKATKADPPAEQAAAGRRPHGRDEVVKSIIDATLSLWAAEGPAKLSMRSIASRAGVNYGLVHRHFGTKDAVIRAAMERVVIRSREHIEGSEDLRSAVERILPLSTGAHARLLAWATLQHVLDDVLPENDAFLEKMQELAQRDIAAAAGGEQLSAEDTTRASIRVGSLIAMLYGWRLFEPSLVRSLGLQDLDPAKLDQYIHDDMLRILGVKD